MEVLSGNIITLIPLILIIFLTLSNKSNFKKKSTKHYLYALIITTIISILEIYLMYDSCVAECNTYLTLLAILGTGILSPLVGYNLSAITLIGTSYEKYKVFFMVPLIVNFLLSFSRIFMCLDYLIYSPKSYYNTWLFWVHFSIGIFYLIIFLILDIKKSKKNYFDDKLCFFITYTMMIGCIFSQVFFSDFILMWPSISIVLIFYYISNLNHSLNHDVLTKLFNRHMYEKLLNKYNGKKQVTIINIDINNFKDINDSSGHYVGDETLQIVSSTLNKYFDPYGNIFRVGGDEFCVILTKDLPTEIGLTFPLIEEDLIKTKTVLGIPQLLSYGYSTYTPTLNTDIFHAVKSADKHMYNFKQNYKSKLLK